MSYKNISQSVKKIDHNEKVAGRIKYVGDIKDEEMHHGVLVRSTIPYGEIVEIVYPELEEGYTIISAKDIPGPNIVRIIHEDQPIFAEEWVNYIGEPILMVVGKDIGVVHKIAKEIKVIYKEHKGVLSLEEAIELEPERGSLISYGFGVDPETLSQSEEGAAKIIEESYKSGYQEHVYLEPQGMLATYKDGEVSVQGSLQCPYYVKNAMMSALDCDGDHARVIHSPTGGAFGGKEEFPSMMACQVAVAANKIKAPVMLVFDRTEDMAVTTKRHPSIIKYRTAIDAQGDILSMDVEIFLDGGANMGLSLVVLQRALINSAGVYKIPNFRAKGYVLKTNTVPNGAFRGFGAPQSFAGIESHIGHISLNSSLDPLEYKLNYLVKKGDPTVTNGIFRDEILVEKMVTDLMTSVAYKEKKTEFAQYNKENMRYKKGIGTSLFLHGCGFTGSGEKDHIKAEVKLHKSVEGQVTIKIANIDMGQGLITTMCKIVGQALGINYSEINFPHPDTKYVPDSGPTVASRTIMIVGKLLERAAFRLKETWIGDKEQEITENYVHQEMVAWDEEQFQGDAYPAYSWGVNMVEVKVDQLTGNVELSKVYASYDIGNAIDERIIIGQIEGGITQGIAYGYLEKMTSSQGRIMQKTITDYGPPTSMDVVPIESKLYDNPYVGGPFGAKGAGELMLIGGAPAVQSAIEDAMATQYMQIPISPEVIISQSVEER